MPQNGVPGLRQSESCPALQGNAELQPKIHFSPRYDVFGQQLPPAKGSGLGQKTQMERAVRFETAAPPENWTGEAKFNTKSELLQDRRAKEHETMTKAQAAVKIRSVEELAGSHQVNELVKGTFYATETADMKARSKLLEERRSNNLSDLQGQVASHITPAQAAKEKVLAGGKVSICTVISPTQQGQVSADKNEDSRPSRGLLKSQSQPHVGPRIEIIRDRPAPPTMQWRDEMRTASEMFRERKESHLRELKVFAQNATPKPTRTIKLRSREAGPLQHMQTAGSSFGESDMYQYDVPSRAKLLHVRKEDLKHSLELVKQQFDGKLASQTGEITEPILRSQTPWWEIGISAETTRRLEEKHKALQDDFDWRASGGVIFEPAKSGNYRTAEIERKKRLKQVPDKINQTHRYNLLEHGTRRITVSNSFTDSTIAFRQQVKHTALNPKGKKLALDPGEGLPLYSSFTIDNIFLEKDQRAAATREMKRREEQKRLGQKLPLRSFKVQRASELTSTAADQNGHYRSAVGTLVGLNAKDSAVRTSGFQNLPRPK